MAAQTITEAFCVPCRRPVPATVREGDGHLYLDTQCPACGPHSTLVEHDAALYRRWETLRRPNRPPEHTQTTTRRGCPFDCGLCANHRQKSCILLIEVTTRCNLGCPVCYASAGQGEDLSLDTFEHMLDAAVEAADGKPEILQLSGGEPTCHSRILDLLRTAKKRPFKYVMLNTNGLTLADGSLNLDALRALGPGFEVYLQFDGLDDGIYRTLRGRPLLAEKLRALDRLAEHGIPATLVATLRRGLNLEQAGDLLRFALRHPAVRGINFQCEAFFGRNPSNEKPPERVTQTEVVRTLERTAGELLGADDVLPLSCGLACMVYLENLTGSWRPIPRALAGAWEKNPLTASVEDVIEAAAGLCACKRGDLLAALAQRLPPDLMAQPVEARSRWVHERFFHVSIAGFLDAWNFDLNRACRECAHVMQPDGRKIPFSAFNTLYREGHV